MNERSVVHLTLRVPAELHEQVKRAAKKEHGSVHSWFLRLAESKVRDVLPKQETAQ